MDSKERILTALNHEEPDRVPIFTLSIESLDVVRGYGGEKVISLYDLDVEKSIKVFKEIGTDLFSIPLVSLPIGGGGVGRKIKWLKGPRWKNMVDEFGRVFTFKRTSPNDPELFQYVGGIFHSESGDLEEVMANYEKWAKLDPNIELRYRPFERALETSGNDGPYIIPNMQGFFESWQPFGYETHVRLLFEHPDFVKEVLMNYQEFYNELIEILAERYSIELLFYLDDLGYKTGPMVSPKSFKQFIYPRIKEFVTKCHANGIKVVHHSCGNVNKLLDMMLDTGIDGLNPLEPTASMDIFKVHRDYGDKLTLIGNVDTAYLLPRGTPDQIADYVKKEVKEIGPGGGLIVSSGHSINPAISFENYRAMIETTKKYGTYPIRQE